MTDRNSQMKANANANRRIAVGLLLLTAAMVGLSFAAVPLYRIFCQTTGYGGTTQRVDAPSGKILNRMIRVRFDANVSSELEWSFFPAQNTIDLKIGQNVLVFYKAVNLTDKPITGSATFNVTPEIAGSYFNKVQCFCFTEQTLQPGEKADMPVSFFIDPAIVDDPDAKHIKEITLSYTFFKVDREDESVESRPSQGAARRAFEKENRSG